MYLKHDLKVKSNKTKWWINVHMNQQRTVTHHYFPAFFLIIFTVPFICKVCVYTNIYNLNMYMHIYDTHIYDINITHIYKHIYKTHIHTYSIYMSLCLPWEVQC